MCRPMVAIGAALAVMVACCVAPAAAQPGRLWQPQGPSAIGVRDAREAALYQSILGGIVEMAEDANLNRTRPAPPAGVSIAAVAPPVKNVSTKEVVSAIANVMAASLIDTVEELAWASLGDPSVYKYPDGSGRVALFRLPKGRTPIGTCIFIHGCYHDPYSWFYKSKKCPLCTGLPEEVSHTKQCLARGYAVLALMSKDRTRQRCFSSSGAGNDQESAKQIIMKWTREFKLNKKPKYMFGISAGAAFAIKFPSVAAKSPVFPLQGIVSEVNMPSLKSWNLVDSRNRTRVPIPPTVFYQMERDLKTAGEIKAALEVYAFNRIPADVVYAPPRPVTATFLYERSIYITKQQSKQVADWLFKIGVIDKNGNVKFDVRVKRWWTTELPKHIKWLKPGSPYYNLKSDESQIWQELNLAWSWHEIVSDFVRPTLAWLEKGGKANLTALVKQMDLNGSLRCLNERTEGCRRRRTRRLM